MPRAAVARGIFVESANSSNDLWERNNHDVSKVMSIVVCPQQMHGRVRAVTSDESDRKQEMPGVRCPEEPLLRARSRLADLADLGVGDESPIEPGEPGTGRPPVQTWSW